MKNRYRIVVKAPIEAVFEYLSDEDKGKLWIKELESVEYPNGVNAEAPVGTKMVEGVRQGGKVQHNVGEITAYDKPHLLGLRLANESFTVDIVYHLSTIPEGTRLEYEGDLRSHSAFLTLMLPLIQLSNRRLLKKQMLLLKWSAEARNG